MRELRSKANCEACPFHQRQSISSGLEGFGQNKSVVLVLQNSDKREGEDYYSALLASQTGKRILSITEGQLSDTIIINAVKCKFDPGQTPPKTAVSACQKNTLAQLEELKAQHPAIGIVCIGKVAAEVILPQKDFAEVRGKIHQKNGQRILVIGHVSRGARKAELLKARKFVEGLRRETKPTPVPV